MSSVKLNSSTVDVEAFLEEMDKTHRPRILAAFVLLCFSLCIGLVGNFHVLFIYVLRMKDNNQRTFTIFIASVDILTCLLSIPFQLYLYVYSFSFRHVILCKMMRFVQYLLQGSSSFILVWVAIERYLKTCRPFGRQLTTFQVKGICALALILCASMTWPAGLFYGIDKIAVEIYVSPSCFIEHYYGVSTPFVVYWIILLGITVGVGFVFMLVMYVKIWKTILRHLQFVSLLKPKYANHNLESKQNKARVSEVNTQASSSRKDDSGIRTEEDEITTEHNSAVESMQETRKRMVSMNVSKSSLRPLLLFAMITFVFIFTYIPHIIIHILGNVQNESITGRTLATHMLFELMNQFPFFASAINPFIYGWFDKRMRQEIVKFYKCQHR